MCDILTNLFDSSLWYERLKHEEIKVEKGTHLPLIGIHFFHYLPDFLFLFLPANLET